MKTDTKTKSLRQKTRRANLVRNMSLGKYFARFRHNGKLIWRGLDISYGYFEHTSFVRHKGRDVVEIHFQDRVVTVRGKALEPLCDALERLVVEKIRLRPEKYACLAKNEAVIEEINVSNGTTSALRPRIRDMT